LFGKNGGKKIFKMEEKQREKMIEFYSKFIKPDDLCFDIGANIGEYTKTFLELGAVVVVVEPQDCITRIPINKNIIKIQKALGESEGQKKMMISNANTLSSLSKDWIEAVSKSGRFPSFSYTWNKEKIVQIITLDNLIEKYGMPSFIKIDVEGYEYQVIKGLSKPVQALSIEFTPEILEPTFQCINYLSKLGDIELNYSFGDTMLLSLKEWTTPKELIKIFLDYKNNGSWPRSSNVEYGDVYIRFKNGGESEDGTKS